MTRDELAIVRRAYARQVLAAAGVVDERLEDAFAAVPRERFLGPGPWRVIRGGRYRPTPSDDPVYLYTDDLVAIDAPRRLNNGQPSFHALLMARAAPRPGEHAVHVGAGVGYYSAILGETVGAAGWVTAIEHDPDLAARARDHLAPYRHVEAVAGDGATARFAPADVIYVNAGVTRPADLWLDGLKEGGRLVLPLTAARGFGEIAPATMGRHGAVFLITRRGASFDARRISSTAIFPCASLRDDASERRLADAFARDDGSRVARLHRHDDVPDELCWLEGGGWALTTE